MAVAEGNRALKKGRIARISRRRVPHDLPEGIACLQRSDEAMHRIMNTVEMPNRVARDFIMFVRQNGGSSSKRRRSKGFEVLTDAEVHKLETIVNDMFNGKFKKQFHVSSSLMLATRHGQRSEARLLAYTLATTAIWYKS